MFERLSKLEQLCVKLSYLPLSIQKKWRAFGYFVAHPLTELAQQGPIIMRELQISQHQDLFLHYWRELDEQKLADLTAEQKFITILSEEYPDVLKETYQPPLVLFYEGDKSLLHQRQIAIVGSRLASPYAYQVMERLLPPLIDDGLVITSGLAKGVDSYAHQLAMIYHGKTIGVVGCGIDICYPKEVRSVYERMKNQQLIVSEYPTTTPVRRFHFPLRNRIIAGLAEGVCVIEAKDKSGSLITAQTCY
ncbi:DNA-processing protein DprA [Enterococcus cecorum]